MSSYTWPDVFEKGYVPLDSNKAALLADALSAWGVVMAGNKPPEHFGAVMAIIAHRLGVSGTPDSLMALSAKAFPRMTS